MNSSILLNICKIVESCSRFLFGHNQELEKETWDIFYESAVFKFKIWIMHHHLSELWQQINDLMSVFGFSFLKQKQTKKCLPAHQQNAIKKNFFYVNYY